MTLLKLISAQADVCLEAGHCKQRMTVSATTLLENNVNDMPKE